MKGSHSTNYLLMAITSMKPTRRKCGIKRNISSVCLEIVQVCLLCWAICRCRTKCNRK